MELEKMTCKQYLSEKMEEYKKTNYYKKALVLKEKHPSLFNDIINEKEKKFIEEWKEYIKEYGRCNILDNKIIYSYARQFGYENMLYDFRRGMKALENFIPTEKYTINIKKYVKVV